MLDTAPVPLTAEALAARDARLAVLAELDRFTHDGNLTHSTADRQFSALYNAGKIVVDAWVRADILKTEPRTLRAWRSARDSGEASRLAVGRGAARRGKARQLSQECFAGRAALGVRFGDEGESPLVLSGIVVDVHTPIPLREQRVGRLGQPQRLELGEAERNSADPDSKRRQFQAWRKGPRQTKPNLEEVNVAAADKVARVAPGTALAADYMRGFRAGYIIEHRPVS